MTRANIFSLLRHVVSMVGGILIARGLVAHEVGQQIIGAALSIVSVIASILDKSYTINQIEGTIRQLLTTLSSFMAFKSTLDPNTIEMIVAGVSTLLVTYLGISDKAKPEVPTMEAIDKLKEDAMDN